jgi:GT2 family glycosyltransferase
LKKLDRKIAAVVVAYKNTDDIATCYARLQEIPEIQSIVLVDNSYGEVGSCLAYAGIEAIDDRTVHVVPPANLGYAGGNNFGIDVARRDGADYILVCNPDVLLETETVACLLDEMHNRSLDLISPQLLEVDNAGLNKTISNPGWDRYLGRGVVEIPRSRPASRYISTFYGACFMVSSRLLDQIGGLSEDLFLYGEEIDYTVRINGSNFSWAISARYVVAHARGSSISPGRDGKSITSFFHSARSAVIVGRKYWPSSVFGWIAARMMLAGYLTVRGRSAESRAIVGGLVRGLRSPLSG